MEPGAIAEGIARLMDDPALAERLRRNLALEPLGTEDEVRKFDELTGTGELAGADRLAVPAEASAPGEPVGAAGSAGSSGAGSRTAVLAEGSGGR